MSRIGRQPVNIPQGVEASFKDGLLTVKGPKGTLGLGISSPVDATIKGQEIVLSVKNPDIKRESALWGLFRSLTKNMVIGVTQGFTKQLEIQGVGYKAAVSGNNFVLHVGFSHPVEYKIPARIELRVNKNIIEISGIDKQQVGQVAAEIRKIRPVEPYKGKGIRYVNEVVRRKVGKAAVKTE